MTESTRVLVADDEPLAREGLVAALAHAPGVVVVAACADGVDALDAIRRLRPDVALLDVQMPGLDGLAVAAALMGESGAGGGRPAVVFVTAYDEHAVRAFELHAVDYVLKPYSPERVRAAVARAEGRLRAGAAGALDGRMQALLAALEARPRWAERLVVASAGRVEVVPVPDVDWIESEGNYVRLHLGPRSLLHREPLKALLERLDPQRFARVHRSAAVNLDRVRELRPLPNGDYVAVLEDGVRVPLSRTYRDGVLDRLR
jgi:two-component system, LytTR family, response regulator